ncbi:hypothetical protein PO354_20160, partial [Enterobacter roggenkampii]|uniref:hypothetical protein n=1 Tax=Enterobacter roggenkampii TaxID=1812935 RepID=UPI002FFC1663
WLMMSLWDALRMNMMISYQELVRTFPRISAATANTCQVNMTQRGVVNGSGGRRCSKREK